ncbi:Mediator of rna polymerase ii transcription subunit like [Thalictrum thalictroides]|uniref:Mediator of rna polymerase ii transcription subunit like n=1 Tax=Thalictrum thalictroides TaxID=46969 RepID=A0A7J6X7T5_THATH|nr:Mediator of rna polymerase ii transcription subunit like [Thalictrum thalictroides]
MGNCFRHEPSTIWGGEDWSSVISPRTTDKKKGSCHKKRRNSTTKVESVEDKEHVSSTTRLKLKITKKQLQELLSRAEVQGLSVEQVLLEMVHVNDQNHIQHRSWKTDLQVIAEEPDP